MALHEIHPRSAFRLQQVALLRLQLRFTAETHRLYRELYRRLGELVTRAADGDGVVDGPGLMSAMSTVEGLWQEGHRRWVSLFERARQEAASIPFGTLLVLHNHYTRPFGQPQEALDAGQVEAVARAWQERHRRVLAAAAERIYSDGFNLSGRIWRLEMDGLDRIRRTLATAMAGHPTSAAELAQLLEALLGVGQDCPRWAYRRLYGMTPGERALSKEGLLTGDCGSRGLAYNALRMARNELQIAHHRMTDELLRAVPWVQGERVRLSPQHPEPDICDDVANGGPYEPGEIVLPLHVQCMCWKEAVVMGADEFRRRVRGWLAGQDDFLDGYSEWLGIPGTVEAAQPLPWTLLLAQAMARWLAVDEEGHGEALGV
ncbi:hypothetical protein [Caldilinea sp.]|uniref:hypothetical protein n=1 Tax=Caldilinea sp. TaxID=2293560 RepID=UPI0021DED9BE|nr:hypothetical protein [Caldilinea sp.]GIV73549.1 MAG: hypothetical protein KatS3mg049_2105 [Caldilinea sp.]